MKEGISFFKLDGPIGRKKYLFVALLLTVYFSVAVVLMTIFHMLFQLNKYNLILFILLWLCVIVPSFIVLWVNLTKRLWDLIGDKSNAIFYASALWLISFTISFIPVLKILGIIVSVIVPCFLLFKKGKLIDTKISEKSDDVA